MCIWDSGCVTTFQPQALCFENKYRSFSGKSSIQRVLAQSWAHVSIDATIWHCFKTTKKSPVTLLLKIVLKHHFDSEEQKFSILQNPYLLRFRTVACRNVKKLSRALLWYSIPLSLAEVLSNASLLLKILHCQALLSSLFLKSFLSLDEQGFSVKSTPFIGLIRFTRMAITGISTPRLPILWKFKCKVFRTICRYRYQMKRRFCQRFRPGKET